jgi:uncharacterized protein (TIGR02265 family)
MQPAWEEPPWSSPLDTDAVLAAIPEGATVSGLFLSGVRDLARSAEAPLERSRASYVAFKAYPAREHAELMVECAKRVWPALPIRHALRKMGRGAAGLLISSQVGRVLFGSAEEPIAMVQAMARSYASHLRPASVEVVSDGERRLIVRMQEIHYFLDSHHVGVFEGVLRHAAVGGAKIDGKVRIAARSPVAADLLLEWA